MWVATQKTSLSFPFPLHSFSFSFVSFALSFAFSFVHSFSFVSFSFPLIHSFTSFVSFALHSFLSCQCSYINIHIGLSSVGVVNPTTRHSQVSTLDVAVDDLQCLSEGVNVPDIQPQMLLKRTNSLLH